MAGPRRLTGEESRLWREAMRHTVPLRPETDLAQADIPPSPPEPPLPAAKPLPVLELIPLSRPVRRAPPGVGLDKRTRDRFRRGEMEIEASLDLHGTSREMAHDMVVRFLVHSAARGRRCLLVITGKGRGDSPGVLKTELPHWLEQEPLYSLILAIAPARPQHGGSGAFYLLLRRRRE